MWSSSHNNMPDPILCDEIARFFTERLNLNIPSKDANLFEAGFLDSLTFVDLVVYLEQQFGIRISPDELEPDNFRCLTSIADFVSLRSGIRKAAAC